MVVKRYGYRDRDRDNSSDRDSDVDNNDSHGYLESEWWREQESVAVEGHVRGGYSENGVEWKE